MTSFCLFHVFPSAQTTRDQNSPKQPERLGLFTKEMVVNKPISLVFTMGSTIHKHRDAIVLKRRTTKKQGEMAVWMRLTLWPLLFYTCYRSLIAVKSLYPPLGLPRLMLSEKDDASLNAATSAPTTLSAQSIVQRTYEESFASIADRCPKDVNFRNMHCGNFLRRNQQHHKPPLVAAENAERCHGGQRFVGSLARSHE